MTTTEAREDVPAPLHGNVRATSTAPTPPHPHALERPPGNVVLVPVAALPDKIGDRTMPRVAAARTARSPVG